jgi:uncharacterized membrane protein
MARLTVWTFDDAQGASRIELVLGRLAAQDGLLLRDGRVFVWPGDAVRPLTRRIYSVPLTDALDDIVWGLLLGQIVYGSDAAPSGPLVAIGIHRELVERLRKAVVPGRSGLIVLGEEGGNGNEIEQIAQALAPHQADIITTG